MPIEKFAEIAIDGAIWLAGEYLSHGRQMNGAFMPDPAFTYRPRHCEVTIIALDRANQRLRHRIFVEGFRKLPNSGTYGTFERLLTRHREMMEEAFRTEWQRRLGPVLNADQSRSISKSAATNCFQVPQILVRLTS